MVFADDKNLTVLDIEEAKVVNATIGNSGITKLVKLGVHHETGNPTFGCCTSSGVLKICTEGQEETAKWIDTVRVFKSHLGQVSDIINLPNGALVCCGHDKNICIWEEKKGGASCNACCQIF